MKVIDVDDGILLIKSKNNLDAENVLNMIDKHNGICIPIIVYNEDTELTLLKKNRLIIDRKEMPEII